MSGTDPSASGWDATHRYLRIKAEWRPADVLAILQVSGEIDTDSSRTLDHWLRKRIPSGSRYVVVDLSSVSMLGAAGVRVLVEHTDRQALAGRRMLTVAGNPHVQRILRLMEATKVVGMHDSVPTAIAACLASGRPGPPASPADDRSAMTAMADGDVVSLHQEVFRLRAVLRTRPVVARAVGVIQERYDLSDSATAFGLLRENAKKHDLDPYVLAQALLAAAAPRAEVWFPGRSRVPAPALSFSQLRRQDKGDRTAVLRLLLDAAVEYLHTRMGDVQLVDVEGSRPRLVLHRNLTPNLVDHLCDLDDPAATATQAATSKARLVQDMLAHPSGAMWAKSSIRTIHSTPLVFDDHCEGVVSTYHSEPGYRPTRLQCAKLDYAATETAGWLAWHQRTVIVDALEGLHHDASHNSSA